MLSFRATDHRVQRPPFPEGETEAQRAEITCQRSGSGAGPHSEGTPSLRKGSVLDTTGLQEQIILRRPANTNYFCKRVCLFVLVGNRERVLPRMAVRATPRPRLRSDPPWLAGTTTDSQAKDVRCKNGAKFPILKITL